MTFAVPRLLFLDVAKHWTRDPTFWSPRKLLTAASASSTSSNPSSSNNYFPPSLSLTVKQSFTSRYFMYEEHGKSKRTDNMNDQSPMNNIQMVQRSPAELAEMIHDGQGATNVDLKNNQDLSQQQQQQQQQQQLKPERYYCYWTSPIADVAPCLLTEKLQGYETLHSNLAPFNNNHKGLMQQSQSQLNQQQQQQQVSLDPRGPSLWMGSFGSGTQAHYDVADNVIVQLYGTKRITLYHPKAATALYLYPDAHARARKSQLNFDLLQQQQEQRQQLSSRMPLPSPVLDVVLKPGDAIHIPAFWFHHVQNGYQQQREQTLQHEQDVGDGPSVSLNLFAVSSSMTIAQNIFNDASHPFGYMSTKMTTIGDARSQRRRRRRLRDALTSNNNNNNNNYHDNDTKKDEEDDLQLQKELQEEHAEFVIAALHALIWNLFEGIAAVSSATTDAGDAMKKINLGTPQSFIQTFLLDTRYTSLLLRQEEQEQQHCCENESINSQDKDNNCHNFVTNPFLRSKSERTTERRILTVLEREQVDQCIARILPHFTALRGDRDTSQSDNDNGNDNTQIGNAIVALVVGHLLELWTVELAGAPFVADALKAVLSLNDVISEIQPK